MKAASIVVETLAELGISHIAGVIGSSIEDIIDALNGDQRIRYLSVRHEQVAASMCDGYAKVVGQPMACMGHAGPGACNLIIGVASAFRDATPMLVFTGNTGTSRLGRDAWHEIDVSALFAPITKWTTRVRRTADLADVIRRAYSVAVEGRPGPVHIDIPQDLIAAEVTDQRREGDRHHKPFYLGRKSFDPKIASQVLNRIALARKPVLLAGGGVFWSGAWDVLERFSSTLSIPVVTTETSRGVLPEDHPNCLGLVGLYGNPGSNRAIRDADLIIAVGCRFSEVTTLGWTLIPPGASIIQADVDAREIGKQFPVELGLTVDPSSFLAGLLLLMENQSDGHHAAMATRALWISELQTSRAESNTEFFSKVGDDIPLKPQTITKEIIDIAGREAIFAVGQGNSTASFIRAPVYGPGRYLQSAGLGAMGYAFPAALGAKLASPSRPVFCLAGDGDFGMVMQDLDTAAREKLSIVIVVYNNGGYGVNKLGQLARKKTPFGVDFINPDFAALARMYGLNGYRINTRQELRTALSAAILSESASLLDVMVDPAERVGQNPKAVGLYT